MKSKTLEHFEMYNREFNLRKYYEVVHDVDIRNDEDEFYKLLMEATFKSSPRLKDKTIDFEKEYESKIKDNDEAKKELFQTYAVLGMMGFWLEYKQIYKFDVDTLEMVMSSECKDLTSEEIKSLKMPYECFAIENEIPYRDVVIDSTMISKRYNEESGSTLLSIYGYVKESVSQKMLRLDIIIENNNTLFNYIDENAQDDCQDFIKKIMNLVMYLCQPKVDKVVKAIRHKNNGNKKEIKKEIPKHFYNIDYEHNEIGVKLGNAIRNYRIVYEKGDSLSNPNGKKRVVKPHTRCGHYHHYWIGKGRTDLIVKYIEPTFVLGGNKVATMHKVKN